MPEHNTHTAVLIFIRSPHEEVRVKPLFSRLGFKNQLEGIRILNRHAHTIARATHLPVFTICGEEQKGQYFGERLYDALKKVFDKGYRNVIIIGNDCLGLQPRDIQSAARALDHNSLVAGPDHNGGTYLIGIQKELFEAICFMELPWQHSGLLDALLKQTAEQGKAYKLLAEQSDANDYRTFIRLLESLRFSSFKRQLLAISGRFFQPLYFHESAISSDFFRNNFLLRGPPSSISTYLSL